MSKKSNFFKILGIIFLLFSFYVAYKVREGESFKVFLFIVIICVSTDIGGYVFGKIFKGPKLTKISPKKTYAGVVGGYLFAIIFMTIFFNYFDYITKIVNLEVSSKELSINNFIFTILQKIYRNIFCN